MLERRIGIEFEIGKILEKRKKSPRCQVVLSDWLDTHGWVLTGLVAGDEEDGGYGEV